MRLIDVDEIKLPKGFFNKFDNVPKFYEWLGTLPTVDAVPVVRCKDCKWREKLGCAVSIVDESDMPKDDDFCVWGERREDGKI